MKLSSHNTKIIQQTVISRWPGKIVVIFAARGRQVAMWGPSKLLTKGDNLTKIISSVVGTQLYYNVVGSWLYYNVVGSLLHYNVVGSKLHYTMADSMLSPTSLMLASTTREPLDQGLHQLSDVFTITGQYYCLHLLHLLRQDQLQMARREEGWTRWPGGMGHGGEERNHGKIITLCNYVLSFPSFHTIISLPFCSIKPVSAQALT